MTQNTNLPVHILIVDDHPNTATTLARAVSQMGAHVKAHAASSGREALEIVRHNPADILITDMIMPEMNGLDLVEKLQNHPGGRPAHIILITAYDVPGLKETARRLKVDEIIAKPVRPEHICKSVQKFLDEWKQTPSTAQAVESRTGFKILLADDVSDNITLLARYIENEGYQYVTARDGMETLEKTRAELPDLILLDINMPKMDGFAVLEEIRSDPAIQHIPVIILTAARLDPSDIQSGLMLGADDYVTKPFDRRELMARIRTKLRVKQAEDVIRRRNRELSLLPEIGKELSARMDMEDLSQILLKRTVEALGALAGYLILFSQEGGQTQKTYRLVKNNPDGEFAMPRELLEAITQTRQGLVFPNVKDDPLWDNVPRGSYNAAVAVPLLGRINLLGILILTHEIAGYFNTDHMLLLQAIASQAAIAVENARLFAAVSMEQKRLEAVLQSAADAILVFDDKNRLILLNPAGKQLFPASEGNLGLPLPHGKGYNALIDLLEQSAAANAPVSREISWPGGRVLAAFVTPIGNGEKVAALHPIR